MKKLVLILLLLSWILGSFAQNIAWQRHEGARIKSKNWYGYNDSSHDLCVDNQGYVYVTGHYLNKFNDTTNQSITPYVYFGNDSFIVDPNNTASGGFIVKYDAIGNPVWSLNIKPEPGAATIIPSAICADQLGNIYITGWFRGKYKFGVATSLTSTSNTSEDIFVAKYDAATSQLLWVKNYGTGSQWANSNTGSDIKADAAGNIYVSGRYRGIVNFGTGNLLSGGQGSWTVEAFLVKYNPAGTALWAKTTLTSNGSIYVHGMTLDQQGNIYLGGDFFSQNCSFGNNINIVAVINPQTNLSSVDMWLAKYDNNGNVLWAKGMGTDSEDDHIGDVSSDQAGNVYLTGSFAGVTNLSGIQLVSSTTECFVVKYTPGGVSLWAQKLGMSSGGKGIATDANGISYVQGISYGTSATYNITVNETHDFVARFDLNGTVSWMKPLIYRGDNSTLYGWFNPIALGPDCQVYISGGFGDTNPVNGNGSFTPIISRDIYVMRVNDSLKSCCIPPTVSISNDTTINAGGIAVLSAGGGATYSWQPATGLTCTNCASPTATPSVTTTYTVTVTGQNGCPQTAEVTISVLTRPDRCSDGSEIFVANAFSPNGDGHNDRIAVQGNNMRSVYWAIYDRWGEKVFETEDVSMGWDGTFRGKDMTTAVFVYYLNYTCSDGNSYTRKGNISLLR